MDGRVDLVVGSWQGRGEEGEEGEEEQERDALAYVHFLLWSL